MRGYALAAAGLPLLLLLHSCSSAPAHPTADPDPETHTVRERNWTPTPRESCEEVAADLASPDATVRSTALQRLACRGDEGVPYLVAALDSPLSDVRDSAALWLEHATPPFNRVPSMWNGRFDDLSVTPGCAQPLLIQRVRSHADPVARCRSAEILAALHEKLAPDAVVELQQALADPDPSVCVAVMSALRGTTLSAAVVQRLTRRTEAEVCLSVLANLGEGETCAALPEREMSAFIARCQQHADATVRRAASARLALASATDSLARVLRHHPGGLEPALRRIAGMGPNAAAVVSDVIQLVSPGAGVSVCQLAIEALGRIGSTGQDADAVRALVPLLFQLNSEADRTTCCAAAQALGVVGAGLRDVAVPELCKLLAAATDLRRADARPAREAARALAQLRDPRAIPALIASANADVDAAMEALGRFPDDPRVPAVLAGILNRWHERPLSQVPLGPEGLDQPVPLGGAMQAACLVAPRAGALMAAALADWILHRKLDWEWTKRNPAWASLRSCDNAAMALALYGPSALSAVVDRLDAIAKAKDSNSVGARRLFAWVLARTGTADPASAWQWLSALAQDPEAEVRYGAIYSIVGATWCADRAAAVLEKAVRDDPDLDVRLVAIRWFAEHARDQLPKVLAPLRDDARKLASDPDPEAGAGDSLEDLARQLTRIGDGGFLIELLEGARPSNRRFILRGMSQYGLPADVIKPAVDTHGARLAKLIRAHATDAGEWLAVVDAWNFALNLESTVNYRLADRAAAGDASARDEFERLATLLSPLIEAVKACAGTRSGRGGDSYQSRDGGSVSRLVAASAMGSFGPWAPADWILDHSDEFYAADQWSWPEAVILGRLEHLDVPGQRDEWLAVLSHRRVTAASLPVVERALGESTSMEDVWKCLVWIDCDTRLIAPLLDRFGGEPDKHRDLVAATILAVRARLGPAEHARSIATLLEWLRDGDAQAAGAASAALRWIDTRSPAVQAQLLEAFRHGNVSTMRALAQPLLTSNHPGPPSQEAGDAVMEAIEAHAHLPIRWDSYFHHDSFDTSLVRWAADSPINRGRLAARFLGTHAWMSTDLQPPSFHR
ncbi:MAG: HEAT repeat domain-containing protein [Planctomycetota bacterium]